MHASGSPTEWRPISHPPPLSQREAHVFLILLDAPHLPVSGVLSAEELDRGSRFVSHTDRQRYLAARSAMRCLLASYANLRPAALEFAYSERGRPSLSNPLASPIDFNLAHSGELALLAVCRSRVGVDVESFRRRPRDFMDLANRFFTPGEAEALALLPPDDRWRAFVGAWTTKEAVTKALGEGVTALSQVEVGLRRGEPPALLSAPGGVAKWRLFQVEAGEDFLGAVVVEGEVQTLSTWEWSPGGADGG